MMKKPSDKVKNSKEKRMDDSTQLKNQRIAFADANGFDRVKLPGGLAVEKQDLSVLMNIPTLLCNLLVAEATTGKPTALMAIGTQSKLLFIEKGASESSTSLAHFFGVGYHPEAVNRVRVTILDKLVSSDNVYAKWLSAIFGRPMVYKYAQNRYNKKHTAEEWEQIAALVGKVPKDGKKIAKAIRKYELDHPLDAAFLSKQEIFDIIKDTLDVCEGAKTWYQSHLDFGTFLTDIKEAVQRHQTNSNGMSMQESYNAIKDSLLSAIPDGAKLLYQSMLDHGDRLTVIAAAVAKHQKLHPRATKRESFDTIKNSLPASVTDGAKRTYQSMLDHGDHLTVIAAAILEHQQLHPGTTKLQSFDAIKNSLPASVTDGAKRSYQSMIATNDEQWNTRYDELIEYKRVNGHCNVPQNYQANEALANWVKKQRADYKKFVADNTSFMTQDKITRLDSLGFQWNGREAIEDEKWNTRYEDLQEYKRVNGHCNVPQNYQANEALANWVMHQRAGYKKFVADNTSYMTQDKITRLDSLGFEWNGREAAGDEQWNTRYEDLQEYKRVNGHCNVPQNYQANEALAKWVKKQRAEYKKFVADNTSYMTQDKITRLDSLGFQWNGREAIEDEKWNVRYEDLQEYNRVNGHCIVPSVYQANKALANWVKTQRKQYKKFLAGDTTSMSQDKIARLDSLGFQWATKKVAAKGSVMKTTKKKSPQKKKSSQKMKKKSVKKIPKKKRIETSSSKKTR
ncbi:helicase-associated domain-containing protein [Skeletonema marinoi]|uniref:Helicase-associated domain-containing protein n=1 Tax=Skeletonema marinoi TaxID=267567 RepID=A0AAD8YK97_9STRA|nr:helicase-associated domain-containing protein [Skeletonema marinoi]